MLGSLDETEISQVALSLGIPQLFVEKDFYVTKAIQILANVEDTYFSLVFQGGTSLAKGHRVVERMSEDIDFRICLTAKGEALSRGVRRTKLRRFRRQLIEKLKNVGFDIPDESVRVFFEGKFMRVRAAYEDSDQVNYLKPYIAIDFFLGEVRLPTEKKPITSLAKQILGDLCMHEFVPVSCVALDETAAEKWVALTRRVANTQLKQKKSDQHLVRHLYDLYRLNAEGLLTGEYAELVGDIMQQEKVNYKKYNDEYAKNPIQVSEQAIDLLETDPQWREHWTYFLEQMVYQKIKPSFDMAYQFLQQMSREIFQPSVLSGPRPLRVTE